MNEMSLKKRKSSPQQRKNYMLMGLGNICRGDDGIGSFIAQNFQSDDWLVLDCGTTPENFTSLVKKDQARIPGDSGCSTDESEARRVQGNSFRKDR